MAGSQKNNRPSMHRPHPPFVELEEDRKALTLNEIRKKYKAGPATVERWLGELELHKMGASK